MEIQETPASKPRGLPGHSRAASKAPRWSRMAHDIPQPVCKFPGKLKGHVLGEWHFRTSAHIAGTPWDQLGALLKAPWHFFGRFRGQWHRSESCRKKVWAIVKLSWAIQDHLGNLGAKVERSGHKITLTRCEALKHTVCQNTMGRQCCKWP